MYKKINAIEQKISKIHNIKRETNFFCALLRCTVNIKCKVYKNT